MERFIDATITGRRKEKIDYVKGENQNKKNKSTARLCSNMYCGKRQNENKFITVGICLTKTDQKVSCM